MSKMPQEIFGMGQHSFLEYHYHSIFLFNNSYCT